MNGENIYYITAETEKVRSEALQRRRLAIEIIQNLSEMESVLVRYFSDDSLYSELRSELENAKVILSEVERELDYLTLKLFKYIQSINS